jgi:hypothetical protein
MLANGKEAAWARRKSGTIGKTLGVAELGEACDIVGRSMPLYGRPAAQRYAIDVHTHEPRLIDAILQTCRRILCMIRNLSQAGNAEKSALPSPSLNRGYADIFFFWRNLE